MYDLKTKLDNIFSVYIRKRDTPGKCISCGSSIKFDTSDAGHFFPRQHMSTRFDEKNVNAQCRLCNRYKDGNHKGYERGLVQRYGHDIIARLTNKKNSVRKFTNSDIKQLIVMYQDKTKLLG